MDNFMRHIKMMIPLLIFTILLFFLWRGLHLKPHHIPSPLINRSLPNFRIKSLFDSNHYITNKDFKGHLTLLNVFATWCLTCQVEHPVLMDIARSNQITVYGLNYKDKSMAAKQWLDTYGNPYSKILYDAKGQLGIDLGVYGTPETFLIDSNGVIRYKYIGAVSLQVWRDKLLPQIKHLNKVN